MKLSTARFLIGALLGLAGGQLFAAKQISPPLAAPGVVFIGEPTTVTVTAQVAADAALLPTSVNLVRKTASGSALVLGRMYDDGTHGDAVAGDGTFTLQVLLNEPNPGTVSVAATAAYSGLRNRVSSLFTSIIIQVEPGTSVTVVGPNGKLIDVTDPANPLYGVHVDVPPGALNDDILFTMKRQTLDEPLPEEVVTAGATIKFGPSGTVFQQDITVTVPYQDDDNDGYIDGTTISVDNVCALRYDTDLGQWHYLEKVAQDTVNKTMTFLTDHFSPITVGALDPTKFGRNDASFFTVIR
jgi:hypothetical protein